MQRARDIGPGLAAGILGLCLLAIPAQAAPRDPLLLYAKPQRLVKLPDGRRINIHCTGRGAPTVLLEAGWSASNIVWMRVQPELARATRVCAYDRAGMGFSDPAPGTRDTARLADDLEATLKAARIRGPFVVVAHSMGGMPARVFTDRRLDAVAGVVLVDTSSEYQNQRFENAIPGETARNTRFIAGLGQCLAAAEKGQLAAPGPDQADCVWSPLDAVPPAVNAVYARLTARPAYQRAVLSEFVAMQGVGSAQVAMSRRPWGALPLVVLTAEDTGKDTGHSPRQVARAIEIWRDLHDEQAALSDCGVNRLVEGSGHMVPLEKPQAVIVAVREVIDQARARRGGPSAACATSTAGDKAAPDR